MEEQQLFSDDCPRLLEDILPSEGVTLENIQTFREASGTEEYDGTSVEGLALNPYESVAGDKPLDRDTVRKSLHCLGRCPEDCRPLLSEVQLSDLGITSLNVMRHFVHLQAVYLRNNRLRSLHPLGLLSSLTTLDAANNDITSTEDLMPNTKLEVVDLSGNKLKHLEVSLSARISRIADIIVLPSDGIVDDRVFSQAKTGSELGNAPVWFVEFSGDWSMNTRIRVLKLAGNQISSLHGDISQNRFLRHLDLSNNSLNSVASLPSAVPLEELLLSNNCIEDLEGIEPLKYLISLTVDGNQLRSLSPISCSHHAQLFLLDARRNPSLDDIRLLDPLRNLKHLRSLYLCPGPLEAIQHLRTRVIYRLPFLEYLDGLFITPEEQVDTEAAYGAELEQQCLIWNKLLPGEHFVDRRFLKAEECE